MDMNNLLEKFVQDLYQSKSSNEIMAGLNQLRTWQVEDAITLSDRLNAQINILNIAKDLFNPGDAEGMILTYLLPDCLTIVEDKDKGIIRQHRYLLGEWVSNLDDSDRERLRDHIIQEALSKFNTLEQDAGRAVISALGYRTPEIVKKLQTYVQSFDDRSGDSVLSTLVWLELSGKEREFALSEVHNRVQKRYNQSLFSAITHLQDLSSVPVIVENWLEPGKLRSLGVDASLAFTALREIADLHDEDTEQQDRIWKLSRDIVEQSPKDLYRDFDIGHQIIATNSIHVIPTILRWHGLYGATWFENPPRDRYLMQDRLEKCVKPRQLEGWAQIESHEIFEFLKQDACKDTGQNVFFRSQETRQKDLAWKTLLCAAYEPALNWFDDAVGKETAHFVKEDVMEHLACFRIQPFPKLAVEWITEVYDHPGGSDGREFYRLAAVRMARSAATWESFKALVNFGFTYKQQVILQNSDAVAEVAVNLARQEGQEVIDYLVRLLESSNIPRQRLVCAYALQTITAVQEFQYWLLPHIDLMIALLHDEHRDVIERGTLLNCLAQAPDWDIQETLLGDLLDWVEQPDEGMMLGSLRVLVFHDLIEKYPDLMRNALGMEKDDQGWRLVNRPSEWAPHLIGRLYYAQPEAYANVVAELFSQPDWHPTVQLLNWLNIIHAGEKELPISTVIVDALLRRTQELYSPVYGETEIFDVLATVAPTALIEQDWEAVSDKWIANTQVALANALGRVTTKPDQKNSCLGHLETLATNGNYAVRRSAYRAIAKQSQAYLYQLCQSWSGSPVLNLKIRAAEAIGWIEYTPENSDQDGFSELYTKCKIDAEPKVRDAAQRIWDERRRRFLARDYLQILLDVKGETNREILRAWCYGEALGKIGDDESQMILQEYLSNQVLPPHVRYWLGRILKQIETNWKKTTQKWPKPWVDTKGAIETGTGKLVMAKGKELPVQYSIWRRMGAIPEEKHEWGGTIIVNFMHLMSNQDHAMLELGDGRKGEILFADWSGDIASFVGTGTYPTREIE